MKNRNTTGIVVAIIYCVVLYVYLTDAPPGEAPNNPLWVYSLFPLGVVVITSLFDYVIKFDFFRKKKKQQKKVMNDVEGSEHCSI